MFGEGEAGALLMFVGEQPGDREDLEGRPFVGPAGELLDRALAEAAVDRSRTYVAHAVRHFKFEPRGKRRLHKKPNAAEISACRRWLIAEIARVDPRLIVALGATATRALKGRILPIRANRGTILTTGDGRAVVCVTHPSALLRIVDGTLRRAAFAEFVQDLKSASAIANARSGGPPSAA